MISCSKLKAMIGLKLESWANPKKGTDVDLTGRRCAYRMSTQKNVKINFLVVREATSCLSKKFKNVNKEN